jgi:hypothetical protein
LRLPTQWFTSTEPLAGSWFAVYPPGTAAPSESVEPGCMPVTVMMVRVGGAVAVGCCCWWGPFMDVGVVGLEYLEKSCPTVKSGGVVMIAEGRGVANRRYNKQHRTREHTIHESRVLHKHYA